MQSVMGCSNNDTCDVVPGEAVTGEDVTCVMVETTLPRRARRGVHTPGQGGMVRRGAERPR